MCHVDIKAKNPKFRGQKVAKIWLVFGNQNLDITRVYHIRSFLKHFIQ